MNAREREESMQELLEYHYGCHPDPEAVEAQLGDPRIAALYAEVRDLSRTLGDAAREPSPPLSLTRPVPAPRRWRRRLSRVAACIALLAITVPTALWGWRHVRTEGFRGRAMRLVLTGPRGVPDAAAARFRVETWDLDGEPRPATMEWRILDAAGHELEGGRDAVDGVIDIDVAARLTSARRVEVTAAAGETVEKASLVLEPAGGSPLVHLDVDKPVYRPGETVRTRGVFLDRLTLEPLENLYRLRLVDPKGVEIGRVAVAAEDGVGATAWRVPPRASGGTWAVELRSADDAFTLERREFLVRRFERPQLSKTIELDRETYMPGQRGTAEVAVRRMGKGAAAGAKIAASLVIDGESVWSRTATADASGTTVFVFEIPAAVDRGDARFVAAVTDGGVVETEIEPFVVPTGTVTAHLYPEGGDLVAGAPCRVYVEVLDSLERPIDAAGSVVDDTGAVVARFESEHDGRGRFTVEPVPGRDYSLVLDGHDGAAFALPRAKERGVALLSREDVTPAGGPIELGVHTVGEGPWIVGAFCRGVLVAHDTLAGAGDHEVRLGLPTEIAGVLRVTVFDRELTPVAERLVQRAAARRVSVELEPAAATLRPGREQRIDVVTRDENGTPISATVGLTVNDGAVRALAGGRRIGLADAAALAADVENVGDFDELLGDDAATPRRVDLLLGTRGWRRFAWVDAQKTIADHGDRGRRVLAREGRPQRPAVHDTMSFDLARLSDLERDERTAREGAFAAYALLGLVAIVGTILLCGVKLGGAVTGGSSTGRITGAAAGAAACALFAFVMSATLMRGADRALAKEVGGAAVPRFAAGGEEAPPAHAVWGLELGTNAPAELYFDEDERTIARAVNGVFDVEVGGKGLDVGVDDERLGLRRAFRLPPAPEEFAEIVDGLERIGELSYGVAERWKHGRVREVVREYAHRRTSTDEARTDFTETVYWNPALKTDASGRARVSFDVSDAATTWNVLADAHGARRVGQARTSFATELPLRLEAKIPVETSEGDELRIPVAVMTNGDGPDFVDLFVRATGAATVRGGEETLVDLDDDGSGRAIVAVSVTGAGAASLEVSAAWGRWRDATRRELRVVPRGFPHREVSSGTVSDVVEIAAPFPVTHHDGTASASLRLFPSPLATISESLDELLREPSGCFEQTSSTNYPNALVLSFLEATGAAAPATAARARRLLARGYDKLVGYECREHGYEWFGNEPGHEALTAYGLLEFHDMKRVHEVDEEMIERTRAWLLARRDGEGGFEASRHGLDSFGGADPEVTTVYATYALAATGTDAATIARELDHVEILALESDDSYLVAVGACALGAAGRDRAAAAARRRLVTMQGPDGGLEGARTSITRSGENDRAVEATSFAVLAWLESDEELPHALAGLRFLLGRRSPHGGFGATQATIMALKALTAYAEHRYEPAKEGEVIVRVADRVVGRAEVTAGAVRPIVFDGLEKHLAAGVNDVTVEVLGGSELPWIFDLSYRSDEPASAPDSPLELNVSLPRDPVAEGAPVAVEVELANHADTPQPMAVAVVGLPAGLDVESEVLDALVDAGRVDHWELRGRDVVFYWCTLAPRSTRRVVLDASARVPGRTRGPASRAWIYYSPETRVWEHPVRIDVRP